jgi:fructose-specific PTS system IIC-like component
LVRISKDVIRTQEEELIMQEYLDLLRKTREHLMTGVSYMVPVILSGAIPIAIALIIDTDVVNPVAQFFMNVGGVGMGS